MNTTIDLTRGIYRRLYGGFVYGRRINAVSVDAECLLWRLHAICDDFGSFPAGGLYVRNNAAPLRQWTVRKVEALIRELAEGELIDLYLVGHDTFGCIRDFLEMQPAGRNGRRVQRFPRNPQESAHDTGNEASGESGGAVQIHTCSEAVAEAGRQKHKHKHEQGAEVAPSGLPACLRTIGVGEPALTALADCPTLTTDEAAAEWAAVQTRGARLANPVGAFVRTLCRRHHITLPKSGRGALATEINKANTRFLAMRERVRR